MSQFNTSLEFLLKVRAEGQAVLDTVNRQVEGFVAAQGKAGTANLSAASASKQAVGAATTLTEAQRQASQAVAASTTEMTLQRGALSGLAAQAKTAAAAFIGIAGARRALALNAAQEQAESRLLGVLQGQADSRERALEQQRELIALTARLQDELGVFGDEQFLGVAQRISSITGRSDLDFERLIRVTADTAVALYDDNIEGAARSVGRSLIGQVGQLGELVPEVSALRRELAPEEFRRAVGAGAVIDILEERFGGAAAEAANTDTGRQIAARNQLGEELERLGSVLLPPLTASLVGINALLAPLASALQTASGFIRGDKDQVNEAGERLIQQLITPGAALLDAAAFAQFGLGFGGGGLPGVPGTSFRDLRELADQARNARDGVRVEITPQPGDPDYERFLQLRAETERNLEELRKQTEAERPSSRIDFDDATRRELIAQLGLVDELNAELIALEDQFRRLAGLDEFPIRLFEGGEGGALREAEAFFNLAKINITQEQGLRDLAEAQDDYARALRRANDLVEAGQISGGRRNAMLEEAREALRAVIDETQGLSEATETEARRSIDALRALVDEQGELALDLSLGDTTQLSEEIAEAVQRAKERLEDESEELATLSAEVGERAFGPLTSQLDEFLKTGEASLASFAQAVLEIFTRLASEAIVRQFLSGLLGGTPQAPGAGGELSGFGQFLNLFGGIFGFNEGGMTPGATRGFDHRLIAVDGGEFVTPAPVVRMPMVREHLEQLRHGDLSSIDFARLAPRLPAPQRAPGAVAAGVPGYNTGGFVEAFALASSGSAEDRVFGGRSQGSGGGGEIRVVPVAFLDRRTAEAIQGNRASRDVIRRVARDAGNDSASARSGAPGGRGMPS